MQPSGRLQSSFGSNNDNSIVVWKDLHLVPIGDKLSGNNSIRRSVWFNCGRVVLGGGVVVSCFMLVLYVLSSCSKATTNLHPPPQPPLGSTSTAIGKKQSNINIPTAIYYKSLTWFFLGFWGSDSPTITTVWRNSLVWGRDSLPITLQHYTTT